MLDAGFDLRAGLKHPAQVRLITSQSLEISGIDIDIIVEHADTSWAPKLFISAEHGNDRHWEAIIQTYMHCLQWLERFGPEYGVCETFRTFNDFLLSRIGHSHLTPPPYRTLVVREKQDDRTESSPDLGHDDDTISMRTGGPNESGDQAKSFFDLFLSTTSLQDVSTTLLSMSASESYVGTLMTVILSKLAQRTLFMTSAGYFGLGPRTLRAGDRVVILDGGMTPFVLRQSDQSEQWKMVGDCYLNSWMDGEYFGHEVVDATHNRVHARGDDKGGNRSDWPHKNRAQSPTRSYYILV